MISRDALRRQIRSRTELSYSRSGGPGGQNVNKRDTKVTGRLSVADLELPDPADSDRRVSRGTEAEGRCGRRAVADLELPDPADSDRLRRRLGARINSEGFLVVQAETTRSQGRNREEALERLEDLLWRALRPDPRPRKATRPSRAARERRLEAKKRRSARKSSRRKPVSGED